MRGPSGDDFSTAFSAEPRFGDDGVLIARIIAAYRHAAATFEGHGDFDVASISGRSAALHSMLLRGSLADVMPQLRYLATHDLLAGFDEAARSIYSAHKTGDRAYREGRAAGVHKRLDCVTTRSSICHSPRSLRPTFWDAFLNPPRSS